jgi:hypothetical protein
MEVGATINIISRGYLYTTYKEVFKELGFQDTETNYGDDYISNSDLWSIFAKMQHPDYKYLTLYGIVNSEGKELLIGGDGICSNESDVIGEFNLSLKSLKLLSTQYPSDQNFGRAVRYLLTK